MRNTTVIFAIGVSILVIIAYCAVFLPPETNPETISHQVIPNGAGMQDYQSTDYFNGVFTRSKPLVMNETVQLTLEIVPDIDLEDTHIVFRLPWGIEHIDGKAEVDLGAVQASDIRTVTINVRMTGIAEVRNLHVVVSANSSGNSLSKVYYLPPESGVIDQHIATGIANIEGIGSPVAVIGGNEAFPPSEKISVEEYCSSIWVHGTFFYENEDLGMSPVRNALVEVYDLDETQQNPTYQFLGSTYTDYSGLFSLNVDGVDEVGGRDLYVTIWSISEPAEVIYLISESEGYCYYWAPDVYHDVQGSELDIGNSLIRINSPALQAMDAVIDERDWIYKRTSWERPCIVIVWPDPRPPDKAWPCSIGDGILLPEDHALWDHNTVYHEYGHCVQWNLYGGMWPPSGITDMNHTIISEKDGGFALMEGWAEFMQCAVDDDPDALYTVYSGHAGNIETNDFYNWLDTGDTDGEIIEGSVASILWDIYDMGHAYDDGIDNQFGKIFEIMKTKPDDIRAFLIKWDELGYNQASALDSICELYGVPPNFHPPLNTPPNTPSPPAGESSGIPGTLYAYMTSATDPDGDQIKYTFDWADGETSETGFISSGSTQTSSHSWSGAGTYLVKVKATDSKGASSVWSGALTVTIDAANTPPNTPSPPAGETNGNPGTMYAYMTSATDPDGDQVKYTFDWGDGETSETGFISSGSTQISSHSWSGAGTYLVKAKATDSKGASSGWSGTLTVTIDAANTPPNTPSPPAGESSGIPGTLYAYMTSATDSDGDQVKYTFDWGDGETSETGFISSGSTQTSSHSWSGAGTYLVKAKATDSHGASSGWSGTLTVTIDAANTPPNTPSPPAGESSGIPGTLYAYMTSATDPDGDQVKYTFDWGDGETSETGFVSSGSTRTSSHSWSGSGTYLVKAKATDSHGASSGWSDALTMTIETSTDLAALFTANVTLGTTPHTVQFTDTSTGSPTTWNWTFGDGATSTDQNPTHTYQTEGTYDVTLTVSNVEGTDSLTKTGYITVTPPSFLTFDIPLVPGWNLISIPVTNAELTIPPQMGDIVYVYDSTGQTYVADNIANLEPCKGYWVSATAACTLTGSGNGMECYAADLSPGWNMIGSVCENISLDNLEAVLTGSVQDYAYSYDPQIQSYVSTTTLNPCCGYWVSAREYCTLDVRTNVSG